MSTHVVSRYLYHVLSIHYVNIDNTKIKGTETVLARTGGWPEPEINKEASVHRSGLCAHFVRLTLAGS